MAGFHATLFNGGTVPDEWGRQRLYLGQSGNYLVLTPDLVGTATSYGGAVSASLPAGWRYAKKYGAVNYGAALYDTPMQLLGVPAEAGAVRQTVAFVGRANQFLLNPGIADHIVIGARHGGLDYTGWGCNRSDAILIGGAGIWGLSKPPCTIEGIEGGAFDNVWPMPIGESYLGLSPVDEAMFVYESLQYGNNPVFRFRVMNRVSTLYDSGARYPTGTPFTNANNCVLLAGVNMDDTYTYRFAIDRMWSFMHPRDTEVPVSVIRDTIGY